MRRSSAISELRRQINKDFPAVALEARVSVDVLGGIAGELTQSELCRTFDMTDQTIRNWAGRGLPWKRGPGGKPRYPAVLALAWGRVWTALEAQKKAPKWLTPGQALFIDLLSQYENQRDEEWCKANGPAYAIVPLDWDHPLRELMLKIAARGAMPPLDTVDAESETPSAALGELFGLRPDVFLSSPGE